MQIFFTFNDPFKSASYLYKKDKRRANKQLIEGIQLLNNCCLYTGARPRPITQFSEPYKKRSFPPIFQEWLLKSTGNIEWFTLFLYQLGLYFPENRSIHPVSGINNLQCTESLKSFIDTSKRTPFPNYAKNIEKKLDFTNIKPTTKAYKLYLDAQLIK